MGKHYLTGLTAVSRFSAELIKKQALPEKDALLAPRKDPEVFSIFSDSFLACLVGKMSYKSSVKNQRISSFVTVSDEAYTLLYLENCYDSWKAEATSAAEVKKKYTDQPQSSSRYKGWNEEGIVRYNELIAATQIARKGRTCEIIEEDLQENWKQNGSKNHKKMACRVFTASTRAVWADEDNDVVNKDNEEEESEDDEEDIYS